MANSQNVEPGNCHAVWSDGVRRPEILIFGCYDSHIPPDSIILPQQTHSTNVRIVTQEDVKALHDGSASNDELFADTDALITLLPDTPVGVRTADCVPVLLHAADIQAVAAVHAGWKGTLGNIVGKTVERLQALGADTTSIHAYIAPCICGDCYEVSPELAEEFDTAVLRGAVTRSAGKRPHIDLRDCNRRLLIEAGVNPEHIRVSDHCTRHTTVRHPNPHTSSDAEYQYYSYRRTPGETRRNISAIMLTTK